MLSHVIRIFPLIFLPYATVPLDPYIFKTKLVVLHTKPIFVPPMLHTWDPHLDILQQGLLHIPHLKVEIKRLKLEYITKRKNINLTVSLMNFQSADFYINHIRPFI